MTSRIALLFCLALALTSCAYPGIETTQSGEMPSTSDTAVKTTFTLSLPSVARYVVTDKSGAASRTADSRLFMGATKVVFEIWESDTWYETMRGQWTSTVPVALSHNSPASHSLSFTMPTGRYLPKVRVYNDYVSTDYLAAEYDYNPNYTNWYYIDHTAGTIVVSLNPAENNFAFHLTPTNITAIPRNDAVPGAFDETSDIPINFKGEAWFSFENRDGLTDITCTTISGDADLYVFDQATNALLDSSFNAGIIDDVVTIDRGADDTPKIYLIGVWGYDAGGTLYKLLIHESTATGTVIID